MAAKCTTGNLEIVSVDGTWFKVDKHALSSSR